MRIGALTPHGVGLVALLVLGCSHEELMDRVAPPNVDAFARAFLDTLRAGSDSAVLVRLTPRIQEVEHIRDSIAAAREEFPRGVPDQATLVSGHAFFPSDDGVIRRELAYEFQTGNEWTLAHLVVLEELGILLVDGVRITRLSASLAATNRFTFEGKSAAHFFMLVAAVGIATFSVVAAILVARTAMPRRWLWAAVALLGAGKFAFNWTTGQTGVHLVSVQLLGVGFYRAGVVAPWLIVLSFPVGALIALERRRRALASRTDAVQLEGGAPAAELPFAPDERDR